MTEHELMAAKYAHTAFSIIYSLPPKGRELTPAELAAELKAQRQREATARQRQRIKEKNARYQAKMRGRNAVVNGAVGIQSTES